MGRVLGLAGLVAALAVATPAQAGDLPVCGKAKASTKAPTMPAGTRTPGACRAGAGPVLESAVQVQRLRAETTAGGYHHLGAGTGGEWGGVSGRIAVVDGAIRPNTYDFVAGRFMVKRDLGNGNMAWLEAGWAETGWVGAGRQHVYTYNSNTRTWQFYDQYTLRPGDRAWIDLHTDGQGVWQAWLWWGNRWNLLTAQRLPVGRSAYIEQYVEVYADPRRAARIDVPPVAVDNVQLRPAVGASRPRYWRSDVNTLTADSAAQRSGGFCLNWKNRFDTWTAGDCPVT
ncbi:hypothetical protein [Actinoplanes sp. NPDC049265]|uniref:hypothetical protein n=1 Tax=Actinoplanes sp. NPDC049265 TaxID=3363902 RepID=UPI00372336C4